eukprot:gene16113-biopygen5453
MILKYREDIERAEVSAYERMQSLRQNLTKEEMGHIKEQLRELHSSLLKRRQKKGMAILNGNHGQSDGLRWLMTKTHIEGHLFSEEDLCSGQRPAETTGTGQEDCQGDEGGVIGPTDRIIGQFVSGNVVNLSHRTLSEVEISLLSKGLKFSPTPTDLDKAQLKADFDVFKRRMRLRWFFRDSESNPLDVNISKFRCKSSWNPPTSDPLLESFLSQLEKDVLSITTDGKYYSNLSSSELSALNNFKCDRNIVIKEADKGSAVVVWDRGDYIEEANRQLGDRQVYEEIEVDPTIELGKAVNNRIIELRVEDPGLKEVTDFLKVNEGKLGEIGRTPEGAILCTVDVVGLYPSIPHGEGLEAIREVLDRRENPNVATDTLVGLASLVLESNYFEFNDKFYRQKLGTAIGTKFAPAYANLFMTGLEERLLKESVDTPIVWMRFIDDVFFIWTHGEEKLETFINFLNSSHDTIKFTGEHSRESISFLDVKGRIIMGFSKI